MKHRSAWFLFLLSLVVPGCGTTSLPAPVSPTQPLPTLQGSYHRVQPGDSFWRIAQSYGLDPNTLATANRLPNTAILKTGQQLFIPLPKESDHFLWPVRGAAANSSTARGLTIQAPAGSLVRASRSGLVAVATRRLSGWGKTIMIDHLDGYLSIYSGFEQILVSPGATVRQGMALGNLGTNALYFEIRFGTRSRDTMALLPPE